MFPLAAKMLPIAFAVIFPIFFVTMFCVVSWTLSQLGGWAALAKHYTATSRPVGTSYAWRSMAFGPFVSYSNCLKVVVSPNGIYLSQVFFFRAGHPPLLIPWSCVGEPYLRGRFWPALIVPIEAAGKSLKLYMPESSIPAIAAQKNPVR